jgi:hypothetical protein
MAKPKHREVWVNLNGAKDFFVILGRVQHAMRKSALPESEIEEFREQARKTKTIPEMIDLCRQWVEVTYDEP